MDIRDEQKMREIIREEVGKIVSEILLTEMAFDLGKYKNQIRNHITQIAINWCLVRYTDYDTKYVPLRKHWSSELLSHLNFIAGLNLKGKNDDATKEKALFSIWNEFDFDTDERSIDMAVASKFESEGIDTYSEQYIQTTKYFKEETKKLVDVIVSGSRKVILEYVKQI